MVRKKNYKDHKCYVCQRDFKSVRAYVQTCSRKCYNYLNTKTYWDDMRLGLKIDPHNPPTKTIFRRIELLK